MQIDLKIDTIQYMLRPMLFAKEKLMFLVTSVLHK